MDDPNAYKIAEAVLLAAGSARLDQYMPYYQEKIIQTTRQILNDMAAWRPIEDAPADTDLLLGWYGTYGKWENGLGYAKKSNTCPAGSSASNGWQHGYATHFKYIEITPPKEVE